MNDESLEQHLRNLPAPELPEAWKTTILSTALREAGTASRLRQVWPPVLVFLRNLFAQNPVTSGAMTALWILIFLFKASTPVETSSNQLLVHFDPNRPIYLTSISEETLLAQFLQEQNEPEPRQIP